MKLNVLAILTLSGMLAAGTAIANGQFEEATPGELPWKTMEVTGELSFDDWPHPEITSADGTVYELMFPRHYVGDLEVDDGQLITVEGYAMEDNLLRDADEREYLFVVKALINGEEYSLPEDWHMGPRGSMMSGRGSMMGDRNQDHGRGPAWTPQRGDRPKARRGR